MVNWVRCADRRRKSEQEWYVRLAELADDEDSAAEWNAGHRMRIVEVALQRVRATTQRRTWACFERHIQEGQRAKTIAEELDLTPNAVYVNANVAYCSECGPLSPNMGRRSPMTESPCPEDCVLLAITAGDDTAPAEQWNVQPCAKCEHRLRRLYTRS